MTENETTNEALAELLERFGSRTLLAHEARTTEQSVREWMTKGRVPKPTARLLTELANQLGWWREEERRANEERLVHGD